MNPWPMIPACDVRPFLNCHGDGTIDFGWITADMAEAIGLHPGPIRLQQGIPGPKGFGNLPVEAYPARIKQLGKLGFRTFADFTSKVADGFLRYRGRAGANPRRGCREPPASRPYRCQKSVPTATDLNAYGVLDLVEPVLWRPRAKAKV